MAGRARGLVMCCLRGGVRGRAAARRQRRLRGLAVHERKVQLQRAEGDVEQNHEQAEKTEASNFNNEDWGGVGGADLRETNVNDCVTLDLGG